tara:strand:+ start:917 stop:1384 length:468 start_codon:yes stop_codon:yes gene_type:complete
MKIVVAGNGVKEFNDNFNKGNWIVLYYADGCGYCQSFKPTWDTYKKQNSHKNLNIAEIPMESLSMLNNDHGIYGFPTVKLFNNGKPKNTFEGERTVSALNSFADMNMENLSDKNVSKILNKVTRNSRSLKGKNKRTSKKKRAPKNGKNSKKNKKK